MSGQPRLRLEAELMVDTAASGSRRAGLRARSSRRQLLYRAGDLYLDVSLEPQSGSPNLALVGQLLDGGTARRNLGDLHVALEYANGERIETRSNRLGEFLLLDIPREQSTLGVAIDGWTRVEVPLPVAALDAAEGDR